LETRLPFPNVLYKEPEKMSSSFMTLIIIYIENC
jgi:hypothetical protein